MATDPKGDPIHIAPEMAVAEETGPFVRGTSLWRDAWRRLLKNKLAVFGLVVVVLITIASITGPTIIQKMFGFTPDYIPTHDLSLTKSFPPFTGPNGEFSWLHPMGTDNAGRDQLARVLQGGQISLLVGVIATLVSLLIGVGYGAIAGYLGGRIDNIMMRFVDVLYSLPYVILVIVLLSMFRSQTPWGQLILLFIALGSVSWLTMARIVRGQVLSLKNQEFVLAARATGVSGTRIVFRHLVPNTLGPVIVYATLTIPQIMLTEAFLSFLGFGVQPPFASWGNLASRGNSEYRNLSLATGVSRCNDGVNALLFEFPGRRIAGRARSADADGIVPLNCMTSDGNLLEVRNLRTYFETEDGTVKAVDDVSFKLKRGETLGIVGESGSGKSVTNLSIIRLISEPPGKIVSGEVLFNGSDLLLLPNEAVRKIRGRRIAMIFQDPMTSLNPFMKISRQLMEMTELHLGHNKAQAREHAIKMLETVGIPDARERADSYPHEFSGGMRQRVMIAMALSCGPELLIADEPTTALDVTIQAQILELIKTLKRETGTSVILITHDLGVVAGMTDYVIVMYAGKIFEQARTQELFSTPGNPYTKGLLKSVPDPTAEQGKLYQIPGLPPDVAHLPPGCPFAPRCERVEEICRREFPPFVQLTPDHHSLCHFASEVYSQSGGKPEA